MIRVQTTWLDQWLDHDSYPTRPVRYRHIDDIARMVPGGVTEAVAAIVERGWCALRIGNHIVILDTPRISLLTDTIEIVR